ncbi:NACHT, LRR and PYD domains-containing protein 1-like isoform X2 [Erinaceus europaeus]|uniref:NACHT, LRR and PYD domains-containing protein 1-like isoform X2 n=1 Tax=Erinaceus europaeus TaxID=9365 RepID=A0A1S3WAL7_ERIEU|nr:NACHT, LRR and PYD domains-containing protein 1-like isoform X2 [Erinaceus europaeus]
MDSRVQEQLSKYLGIMKEEELEEFLHRLPDKETHSDPTTKSWIKLEESAAMEVASCLVSQYGEQKAWDLALHTWEQMGLGDLRAKAQREAALMPGIRERHQSQDRGCSLPTQSLKNEDLHQNFIKLQLLQISHPGRPENRDWFDIMVKKPRQLIEIRQLFGSDSGSQTGLHIVMVHGEAGVGKSTLARQVRAAWGEGRLFRDHFQHVFYINCGELDQFSSMTLAELIQKHSAAPGTPIEEILSQPKQLLFILDGFWWGTKSHLREDCSDKKEVHELLSSLIKKTILPEASLLITARNAVLRSDFSFEYKIYFVEVLGFSESSRKDYFYQYFTKESQASRALTVVESNPALWTLCLMPWVSWLACTCLKQQMERRQKLLLMCQTTTALCLQFLSQSLSGQPFETQLSGLCSLAAERTQQGYTRFSALDLIKHNLNDTIISTLLKMGVLQENHSFILLCFQEFFDALCCVLESNKEGQIRKWLKTRQDVCVAPTTRFLFGLLSEHGVRELESIFRCRLSQEGKMELLQWIQEQLKHMHQSGKPYCLQLLHCLYEIQDGDFLRQVMNYFNGTRIFFQTNMDLLVSTFCIKFCKHIKRLQLRQNGQKIQPEGAPDMILLYLNEVTEESWKILFSILGLMESLKELDLSTNILSEPAVQILCETLSDPRCHLQTLGLNNCGLTSSCCQHLASALSSSPSLTELDLRKYYPDDLGMALLCKGLLHPSCQLRLLRLNRHHLSKKAKQMLIGLEKEKPQLLISHKWDKHGTHLHEDTGAGATSDHTTSQAQQRPESGDSSLIAQIASLSVSSAAPQGDQHMEAMMTRGNFHSSM